MFNRRIASLRATAPVVAAVLLGQGTLASHVHAAATGRPSPAAISALVLTTHDVTQVFGGSFKSFINGVISNQDIASAEKTAGAAAGPNMATAGRVTGYDSVWFRGGRTSYLSVTNAVNVYRSGSYPQGAFAQISHFKAPTRGITFHFASLSGVGDQAASLTFTSHGVTAHGVVFRRGRYLAELLVGAQHAQVNLSGLLRLAGIEDHRLQSSG